MLTRVNALSYTSVANSQACYLNKYIYSSGVQIPTDGVEGFHVVLIQDVQDKRKILMCRQSPVTYLV